MFFWALNMSLYLIWLTYQKVCVTTNKLHTKKTNKRTYLIRPTYQTHHSLDLSMNTTDSFLSVSKRLFLFSFEKNLFFPNLSTKHSIGNIIIFFTKKRKTNSPFELKQWYTYMSLTWCTTTKCVAYGVIFEKIFFENLNQTVKSDILIDR